MDFRRSKRDLRLGLLAQCIEGVVILNYFFFAVRIVGRINSAPCFVAMFIVGKIRFGKCPVCTAVYTFLLGYAGIIHTVCRHRAYHAVFGLCPAV